MSEDGQSSGVVVVVVVVVVTETVMTKNWETNGTRKEEIFIIMPITVATQEVKDR